MCFVSVSLRNMMSNSSLTSKSLSSISLETRPLFMFQHPIFRLFGWFFRVLSSGGFLLSSLPNHSDWTESGNLARMFGFAVVGVGVGSDSGMFVVDSSFFPNTMDLEITHS